MKLVLPSKIDFRSYMEFISERKQLGEFIWESHSPRGTESEDEFINRLLIAQIEPEKDMVPETTYWATLGSEVIGRIALRHRLNTSLEEFGGHIGYEVKPSSRKMGVATEMLKLILLTQKAKEINKILLTCAPNNIASNKTIQKNGGVLFKTSYVERIRRDTNYYWIQL